MTTDPDETVILSPETAQVIPAFVKALAAMDDIPRTSRVSAGPIHYSFAPLDVVLDAVRPHLRANGLALSQIPTTSEGVFTVIWHESGQWLKFSPLLIHPVGSTPQNIGSAITYSRRYAILSILGLATEDDDGRSGSVAATPAAPVENPLTIRVDKALQRMVDLNADGKVAVKEWAQREDRRLSGRAMYEDPEWLSAVEAWLDVNEEPASVPAEPDESPY